MRRALSVGLAALAAALATAAVAGPLTPGAPASGGLAVSVAGPGETARACPSVAVDGRDVSGGCVLIVRSTSVDFTALTPFRAHSLSRCTVELSLRVAGDGRLVADHVEIGDLGGEDSASAFGESVACGDIRPCRRFDRHDRPIWAPPWEGLLATDGGAGPTAELDACFDTCLGKFEGLLTLRLERAGGSGDWRLRAPRSTVGATGFELAGTWRLRPRDGGRLRIATGTEE